MLTTVAEIQALLRDADEAEFAALERSLKADTRKGVVSALEKACKRLEAQRAEVDRVKDMYAFERSFAHGKTDAVIVGLDEVGRGPLAGPLAVGAVVLPNEPLIAGLNDSKQIKEEDREMIAERVKQEALAWTVFLVSPQDIDTFGISASLKRAFTGALRAIEQGGLMPDVVLVDGNPLHIDDREINVVKGDAKCASIAAASIIAKTYRDALMRDLARTYPCYGFDQNKGYGSSQHVEAIRAYGLSPEHRRSFCRSLMQESLF